MVLTRLVLVTRPEPGLSETRHELKKRGWIGVECPALEIKACDSFPPLACKAILLTSGQALPALSQQKRDQLILTVGEKTAGRARQAGFTNVVSASGDARSLIRLCCEKNLTGPEVVLACGEGWQGQDYGKDIRDQISVKTLCAYKVERKKSLPPSVLEAFYKEQIHSVLFYSGETLEAFLSLCPKEVREFYLKKIRAICYSEKIAKKAANSALWLSVTVGKYPSSCL